MSDHHSDIPVDIFRKIMHKLCSRCNCTIIPKKIKFTLDRMCMSGINDPVDGGFFRYSVDDLWMIPHFEKMLISHDIDQA